MQLHKREVARTPGSKAQNSLMAAEHIQWQKKKKALSTFSVCLEPLKREKKLACPKERVQICRGKV